jgi:uncharacterized protein (DUF2236 family)
VGQVPSGVHVEAMLGPTSLSARLLGHPAVLLGGPRALLLQLAHPAVAAAVATVSTFDDDPYGRLARTFAVMTAISFGSPDVAAEAGRALRDRHRSVRGTSGAGVPFAGDDPEAALWVHATLVDTLLAVERRYVGVLDDAGRARLYGESRAVAPAVGVPAGIVPADLAAFERYVEDKLTELLGAVTADARVVAAKVLAPPPVAVLGLLAAPLAAAAKRVTRAVTCDLGPPGLCAAFGLPRSAAGLDGALALALSGPSRLVSPRLPDRAFDPWRLVRFTARLAGEDLPPV